MLQAIAFCVDERDQVATFESASLVRVYRKCRGTWEVLREFPLVRDVSDLAATLADCLALVGDGIGSRIRSDLERLGLQVWELPGEPTELAELVWREEAA